MRDGVPLPAEVLRAAEHRTGAVAWIELLGGLSGRTVRAVHGEDASVVVKGPAPAPEVAVARGLRSTLGHHGVRTPTVFAVIETQGAGTWIVQEYLARPLPRERWGADAEVIGMLRALHAVPPGAVDGLPDQYRPSWDDVLTSAAAASLAADNATTDRLQQLARRAWPLFVPRLVISADPNPLNWRIDDHDRPVLLDWERITVASPAIDLAIVLPGLPDRASVAAVRAVYGEGAPSTDEVLLAKAWSVVEFAASAPPGGPNHDVTASIREEFLRWLQQF
jgi:aminoglycoside phosphotransferase (APT) family kinase protein